MVDGTVVGRGFDVTSRVTVGQTVSLKKFLSRDPMNGGDSTLAEDEIPA